MEMKIVRLSEPSEDSLSIVESIHPAGDVVLNIETFPDETMIHTIKKEEISAPANWKDPVKINEYVTAEYEKQLSKMALSPMTGQIIVTSLGFMPVEPEYADPETVPTNILTLSGPESFIVASTCKMLNRMSLLSRLVTFNGKRFDIPFLALSAVRYRIMFDSAFDLVVRYNTEKHTDIYESLNFFASDTQRRGKLSEFCERLGAPMPVGVGSDVGNLWRSGDKESVFKHCESNVVSTAYLFALMRSSLD